MQTVSLGKETVPTAGFSVRYSFCRVFILAVSNSFIVYFSLFLFSTPAFFIDQVLNIFNSSSFFLSLVLR